MKFGIFISCAVFASIFEITENKNIDGTTRDAHIKTASLVYCETVVGKQTAYHRRNNISTSFAIRISSPKYLYDRVCINIFIKRFWGGFMAKEKKKRLSGIKRISNSTQIPFDMLGYLPYIRMCSNREITIEDAGKIIHYDGECVKVRQRKTEIEICGRGLRIICLSGGCIRVTGYITCVRFDG